MTGTTAPHVENFRLRSAAPPSTVLVLPQNPPCLDFRHTRGPAMNHTKESLRHAQSRLRQAPGRPGLAHLKNRQSAPTLPARSSGTNGHAMNHPTWPTSRPMGKRLLDQDRLHSLRVEFPMSRFQVLQIRSTGSACASSIPSCATLRPPGCRSRFPTVPAPEQPITNSGSHK